MEQLSRISQERKACRLVGLLWVGLQQKGGQSAQNPSRGSTWSEPLHVPLWRLHFLLSFCFMLFLELGKVTLSWNRKGGALWLCGQKRYAVVVRDSGDFNGLRKQEGVDATTGTLKLMTVSFRGDVKAVKFSPAVFGCSGASVEGRVGAGWSSPSGETLRAGVV